MGKEAKKKKKTSVEKSDGESETWSREGVEQNQEKTDERKRQSVTD